MTRCRTPGPSLIAVLLMLVGTAAPSPVSHAQPPGSMGIARRATDKVEHDPRAEASRLRLTTERIAVFKDGYALFVKTAAAVADSRGRVFTDEVPDAAVLGCFWATTSDGEIAAMRAELVTEEREESTEAPCLTIGEILRANVETHVSLTLRDTDRSLTDGTIVRVLETPPEAADPAPGVLRPAEEAGETRTPLVSRGGAYVVMKTGASEWVLPIEHILLVSGDKLETRTTHTHRVKRTTKRLGFELGAAAAGKSASLRIMYFTPGIRWIPTYRLIVNPDNKSGSLALQGELLNECEDVERVAMDMVVGVPNFKFRGTVSPLVMERTLRNALLAAAPDIMGRQNQYSNAMFAQRAGEWREERDGGAITGAALAPELAAGGEQDLFVYSVPAFDLARGDRASVPVLKQSVEFDHLYTLDIAAVRDPRQAGTAQYACKSPGAYAAPPPGSESPSSRFNINQVWHQIELKNASAAPWTTGAALVIGAGEGAGAAGSGRVIPIAQELLRYTPAGGKVLLPLTVAVDVRAELAEEEISREENALKRNGTNYTLVRARSTITLTSSRRESSTTRINLALGGKAIEVSDGGKIVTTGHVSTDWGNNDPGPVNNHSDISWQLELGPGQSKTLTIEFSYYTH